MDITINKEDQELIKSYIAEGRRRFGNNLHDVETFALGCIYADSIKHETQEAN